MITEFMLYISVRPSSAVLAAGIGGVWLAVSTALADGEFPWPRLAQTTHRARPSPTASTALIATIPFYTASLRISQVVYGS
jgi:hypothetical protein